MTVTANPNPGAVFAGGPDRVTGAVLSAPLGTPLPTSIDDELDSAFEDNGFVTEDGLTLSQSLSFDDIKEWGGTLVRSIQSAFDPTLAWTFLETTDRTMNVVFGDANVTATANTVSTGSLLKIIGSAEQVEPRVFVFRMKDGVRKTMVTVERGQVTDRGDISYTRTGAVTYPVTLKLIPDDDGVSFTIYTDDGIVTGAPIVATGATAGIPGSITPSGAVVPANLAAMTGKTASPTTAWTTGQYVVLANGHAANWTGTVWAEGTAS